MSTGDRVVVGVDVGTGSVRAGVFTLDGSMLGSAFLPIRENHPKPDTYEQSSADIWEQTGRVVRKAVAEARVSADAVVGMSYDATCSLVVLDGGDGPVSVSEQGDDQWNIIVWRDHRAIDQVNRINAGGYDVLKYVGGVMSPEQEPPKLLWIKENLPEAWQDAGKFLDLADFMAYRSTGRDLRSLCTNVCKWTYLGHESRWDESFFEAVGLGDLFDGGRVTDGVVPMGTPAGHLTPDAAEHLGLSTKTIVGVGIIDAHAGGIGVGVDPSILALIGGTSSCHMAVSEEARFINGVWGPYFSAMIPDLWLSEGGQSATGALLDHTIERFGAIKEGEEIRHVVAGRDVNDLYGELNAHITDLGVGPEWTREIHILPYHHGNRSPNADPNARGIVDGLTLDPADMIARFSAHVVRHAGPALPRDDPGGGLRYAAHHRCDGGDRLPDRADQRVRGGHQERAVDPGACRCHATPDPSAQGTRGGAAGVGHPGRGGCRGLWIHSRGDGGHVPRG